MGRFLLSIVAVCWFGCGDTRVDAEASHGNGATPDLQCAEASDCVLAASTCCGCPSYAVSAASQDPDQCVDVTCNEPAACPELDVDCMAGSCVVKCPTISATKECQAGFVRDEWGCLRDECAEDSANKSECEDVSDCVRIAGDCCGCELGGYDIAIAKTDAAAFEDGNMCDRQTDCPGVNSCEPLQLSCEFGSCILSSSATDSPGNGQAEAPSCGQGVMCPQGYECVLNDPTQDDRGITGICQSSG